MLSITLDQEISKKAFGDLLNAEPIGPWLLDKRRRSLLNAVHYLGSDDVLSRRVSRVAGDQDHGKTAGKMAQPSHARRALQAVEEGTVPTNDRLPLTRRRSKGCGPRATRRIPRG